MSTTIESLELEIKSNSKNAISGLDALAQSLEKIKTATKGGLGLSSVAKQIGAIGNATNSINASSANALTGLANAIKLLSGVKISSTIANNLSALSTSLKSMDIGGGAAKIQELATALTPLATKTDKNTLSSTINHLSKLPKVFAELNKVDMAGFATKVKEIATSLEPLATALQPLTANMTTLSKSFSQLPTKLKKVISSTNALTQSNNKGGISFLNFASKITAGYLALKKIVDIIGRFITKSSEYIENVNLFEVSMGTYADEAKAYAETVSDVMGIDPGEWMRNQGIFQTLATGFGVASDKAYIMSRNLTQLGYDITSFFNLEGGVEEGMEKLQSGLAGELEPLRRIGYDLSQAKLEATALELGIDKSVSSMTQAEKAMLRYYAIMTQVTTVQGDMSRTLEAPANQMRVFKAQVEMLARTIGNIFIPILNKVLPYLIAATKVLREMVSAIANLVGFEMPEVDYSGVDSLAGGSEDTATALDDASESAKKLKSYMLGFDELNVISPNDDSSSDSAIGAFDFELPEYDFLGEATNERVEGIISKIKEMMEPLNELLDITVEWAKTLDVAPLLDGLKENGTSLVEQWTILGDTFSWVYEEVLLPIGKWLVESGIPTLLETLAKSTDAMNESIKPVVEALKELKPILEPIISWIGEVVIIVLEGVGEIFEKLAQVFTEKGGDIKDIITGLGEIIAVLWSIIKPILDVLTPMLEDLFDILGDTLAETVGNIIDIVGGIVDFVAGVFTGDWDRAWGGVKDIFSGIWEFIKDLVVGVWDSIKRTFEPVGKWFDDKVVQPVAKFFKGLWESISGFFVNLWKDIKGIWNTVSTWFDENVIQPIVNFFSPIVETISQFFYGCWLIIQAVWVTVSTWFDENVIQPVVVFFEGVWTSVSGFFSNLWDDIVAIWTTVSTWFNDNVVTPVVGFFKGVWTSVSGFFVSLWEDIKGVWNAVSTWFEDTIIAPVSTAFETACEKIGKFFSNLWLGIRQGVAKAMNGVIGGIESAINWVVDGINGLVGGFNKVVQWAADVLDKDWGGINLVQKVSFNRIAVPTYAEGGFPDSGQAFIARENGIPEMVGTIGRRTAVANNEQIVESVASGVAEANGEQNALLREQNTLLRALLEKDSGVYLDGRSLSNSVDKYKREQGRVLITGGVL